MFKRKMKTPHQPASPKRKRRQRIILWSSIGLAVIILGGVAYAMLSRTGDKNWHDPKPVTVPPTEPSRFTALLIGTDTRPGEHGGNTDVLMVLSIDYKAKRIGLLSVPRDTLVQLPNGSTGKINSLYDIGGVPLLDQTVENLIGMDIPNYAITHFGGLVNIIDTVGGVWIDVPERMNYNTGDKVYGIIDLYPGYQKLSGQQALGFARFREDALGDIGRTVRQQLFLKAFEKALLQPSNIPVLPQLVSEFSNTVETNLSKAQELNFATNAKSLKGFTVINMTLPGAYDAANWYVNPNQAKWVTHQFFYQGIKPANMIQTMTQVQQWTPPSQ